MIQNIKEFLFLLTTFTLIAFVLYSVITEDKKALEKCQEKQSYETCFYALNR